MGVAVVGDVWSACNARVYRLIKRDVLCFARFLARRTSRSVATIPRDIRKALSNCSHPRRQDFPSVHIYVAPDFAA
jgi:hypothetical protein